MKTELRAPTGPWDLGDLGQRVQNSITYLTSLHCTLEMAKRIQFRLCACYHDLMINQAFRAGSVKLNSTMAHCPSLPQVPPNPPP